jgi:hypothetical protein
MRNLAKRIAFSIDALARPQGGVARIAYQSVVLVLAASMALCTSRLSLRDAAREEALLGGAPTLENDGRRSPS